MKRIAEVLGVSRSNLADRRSGSAKPRGSYRKADDEGLLSLIRLALGFADRAEDGFPVPET